MAGGAVASNVRAAGPRLTRRQEIFSFALVASLFFLWGFSYGLIDGACCPRIWARSDDLIARTSADRLLDSSRPLSRFCRPAVLNKKVQEQFGITKLQSTLLQVAYFGACESCASTTFPTVLTTLHLADIVYSVPASLFTSRFGYRAGILMGLTLYCLGALAFWPSAHFEKYYGFVISVRSAAAARCSRS